VDAFNRGEAQQINSEKEFERNIVRRQFPHVLMVDTPQTSV
jgi:hypothetical protein